MNKLKLSCLIALAGLLLTISSKAEEVLEFEGQRFVYSTIVQLKFKAGEYLKNLDAKILAKDKAAESPWNPFTSLAANSAARLRWKREQFLKLKWDCPWFSRLGIRCMGWFEHPSPDDKEKCKVTIGTLLGANASY